MTFSEVLVYKPNQFLSTWYLILYWTSSKFTKGCYDILSGILYTVSNIKYKNKELYTFSTYGILR
jgi:hypothetical protein